VRIANTRPEPFKNIQEIHDELTDLLDRVQTFWLDQEGDNAAEQAQGIFNEVEQALIVAEPNQL
tara:strand:+ start:64 stop:255 length:192 start_codon:yes stop_codon:yes gene_type:complete